EEGVERAIGIALGLLGLDADDAEERRRQRLLGGEALEVAVDGAGEVLAALAEEEGGVAVDARAGGGVGGGAIGQEGASRPQALDERAQGARRLLAGE